MKPTTFSNTSFAFLALCFSQGYAIHSGGTTTYIHCNQHLVEGWAKAQAGDWESAALIWNQLASTGYNSVCGKAAYNMVVACEMLNQRALAIKWAHKTIIDYKSGMAKQRALKYLHMVDVPAPNSLGLAITFRN